mmetsp:Transcript_15921/g.19161  ORF Transcript_15921/g.19161 Transcript_15921/m.19161 type:complete len:286 (+) Transcript_15921:299-1156(+)|eukprot:CAMPEP_0197846950 /NCGR_PEP_ID=MMETSP1438-20131217/4734_1 /TAXON_ID=1461541 /ORGANISM="Pterosperma sp., Strain CCMP1384" /LENGTH=285 /DNA_ID=CAMNT_0043458741 /DNA_START=299 /DNA_END=1156 /DNA_ORIENTATION=-
MGNPSRKETSDNLRIRDVWAENLDQEFEIIREIVERYPFIAMDTEFPGVVARPVGNFKNSGEYQYQTLRCNVDMLKLIQLGLTFCDADGNLPRDEKDEFCVWQFNFREFSLKDDMYAQDSIELLKTSGIDFQALQDHGIEIQRFGELLMSSGVILNDEVHWMTFHSGYDFGYLLKVLTCQPLPEGEEDFFNLLKIYFPRIYDMKYLMKFCDSLHGGLNKLAEQLDVQRIGPQHQAGSDSLLTCTTFFELMHNYFGPNSDLGDVEKYVGILYGLGEDGDGEAHRGI